MGGVQMSSCSDGAGMGFGVMQKWARHARSCSDAGHLGACNCQGNSSSAVPNLSFRCTK